MTTFSFHVFAVSLSTTVHLIEKYFQDKQTNIPVLFNFFENGRPEKIR